MTSSHDADRSASPAASSLGSRTLSGLQWTYGRTLVIAIIQIVFAGVMARVLSPEAFGLVAMGMVVVNFGKYFAQLGLSMAIIQKDELTPGEIQAGFSLSLALGVTFFLGAQLLSPVASLFFGTAEVGPILRGLAFIYVALGFSNTAVSLLRRRLAFRPMAIIEVISYVMGYGAIGVSMAFYGFGAWSLVGSSIGQAFLSGVMYYAVCRHPLTLTFVWRDYRDLLGFGSMASVNGVVEFIAQNLDTVMIGRILGASILGLYNRAFMLLRLPGQYFAQSLVKVMFPAFSRVQSDTAKVRKGYLMAISTSAAVLFPLFFGAGIAAEPLILFVLGEQWTASIPILQILSIGVPFELLSHISAVVLGARARLGLRLGIQLVHLALLSVLLAITMKVGLLAVVVALVGAEIVRHLIFFVVMGRVLAIPLGTQLGAYVTPLIGAGFVGAAIFGVNAATSTLEFPTVARLPMALLTGVVSLALLAWYGPLRPIFAALLERILTSRGYGTDRPLPPLLARFLRAKRNWV